MAIETQEVRWSGKSIFPDTADPGVELDDAPLEGMIHFTPVWSESTSGFLTDAAMSIHVRTFTYELHEGRLASRDGDTWVPGVQLPARIGGVTLSWVAKFDIVSGGARVPARDVSFVSNPGGVISLGSVVPGDAVYPAFSPDVVKGDSVEDIYEQNGYLIFIVGTGASARQITVKLPTTSQEAP